MKYDKYINDIVDCIERPDSVKVDPKADAALTFVEYHCSSFEQYHKKIMSIVENSLPKEVKSHSKKYDDNLIKLCNRILTQLDDEEKRTYGKDDAVNFSDFYESLFELLSNVLLVMSNTYNVKNAKFAFTSTNINIEPVLKMLNASDSNGDETDTSEEIDNADEVNKENEPEQAKHLLNKAGDAFNILKSVPQNLAKMYNEKVSQVNKEKNYEITQFASMLLVTYRRVEAIEKRCTL